MKHGMIALGLAALLLGTAACEDSSKEKPAAPAAPAPAPTPAPAPAAEAPPAPAPTPAPAAPSAPATPSGNLRGDAAAGALLYSTYCASCHGPKGAGDGPIAASMNPRPANHGDHVYMATLSDGHLYTVISKGGAAVGKSPMMAPWGGVINEQGIRDLIAFIRQLSST
jgi:mono/diheme cytochrome c family protein